MSAAIGCLLALAALQEPASVEPLALARSAAAWLEAVALRGDAGWSWRAAPAEAGEAVHDLYGGAAGVVLFFLELHHATGEGRYLDVARKGGDGLLGALQGLFEAGDAGLYTGVAGVACALEQLCDASGEERFRAGVDRSLEWLEASAGQAGEGVEWSGVTDLISGTAGTGAFLLWIAERRGEARWRALATAAGRRLVERAQPAAAGGLDWAMAEDEPRRLPNYSHGAAGVADFLLALHEATGERTFLEAAVAGGEHLLAIADERGLIYHHTPGGEELYYLGWCHGPAGTSLLFERLGRVTGEERWSQAARKPLAAVLASGLPQARLPGLWNNVGACCGTSGVGEYLLRAQAVRTDPALALLCDRIVVDLDARGERVAGGVCWPQAEHRTRPESIQAQSGYAQGAAGIGLWLLHLDGARCGRPPLVELPPVP